MTINEFIKKKGISPQEFAIAIGVSESIVKLWEHGASSPRLIHSLRINRFSKGKIKFEEMLNNKDRSEFLDAKS